MPLAPLTSPHINGAEDLCQSEVERLRGRGADLPALIRGAYCVLSRIRTGEISVMTTRIDTMPPWSVL